MFKCVVLTLWLVFCGGGESLLWWDMFEMGFKMQGSSIVRSLYWIDWLVDHNRKYGGWGKKIFTKLIIYEPVSKINHVCLCFEF